MSSMSDPTGRFTARAGDYAKWRPGYPAEAVSFLCERLGWRKGDVVADLGSGTGIMTELLLDAGLWVAAVEPNAEMRRIAEEALGERDGFTSVAGSAEATTLADTSMDGAVAAQAFHWFDPVTTRVELRRVLKSPARVGVVWNVRQTDSTPFLRAYEAFLHEWGTDYAEVQARQEHPEAALDAFFDGTCLESATFTNAQHFGYEGLEGRLLSSSYVPKAGDATFEPMLVALKRLFAEYEVSGEVAFRYDVRAYAGTLR